MTGAGREEAERAARSALWQARSLWLLYLAANLALVALAYGWLWIPDARAWQVAASLLLGLLLVLAFLWLQGSTWAYFATVHGGAAGSLWTEFRGTLRLLPALGMWALLVLLLYLGWSLAAEAVPGGALWLASGLTYLIRKPVNPETVGAVLAAGSWVIGWILIPLWLLPLGVGAAAGGSAAFRRSELRRVFKVCRRVRYWMSYVALFSLGVYLPTKLTLWVPAVESLWGQAASLAARFLAAYLLFVTAWLLLCSLVARLRHDAGEG